MIDLAIKGFATIGLLTTLAICFLLSVFIYIKAGDYWKDYKRRLDNE